MLFSNKYYLYGNLISTYLVTQYYSTKFALTRYAPNIVPPQNYYYLFHFLKNNFVFLQSTSLKFVCCLFPRFKLNHLSIFIRVVIAVNFTFTLNIAHPQGGVAMGPIKSLVFITYIVCRDKTRSIYKISGLFSTKPTEWTISSLCVCTALSCGHWGRCWPPPRSLGST